MTEKKIPFAKAGGVLLYILHKLTSAEDKKWIKKQWVDEDELIYIFVESAKRGRKIYTHFEWGDPWGTLHDDLAAFLEIKYVDVELRLVIRQDQDKGFAIEEKLFIMLTGRGRRTAESGEIPPEYGEVLNDIMTSIAISR